MALNERQIATLLDKLDPNRVGRNDKGFSHLEAWDVRRWLTRIFGFTGWSVETLELVAVAENIYEDGKRNGRPFYRASVVYRAQVRLTVKDTDGNIIGQWDDGAAGDATNMPSVGDAHDMAMKTALSQALKRCAVNLGDQFGLSLYNGGDTRPVVSGSVAYDGSGPRAEHDTPVQPDPESTTVDAHPSPADGIVDQAVQAMNQMTELLTGHHVGEAGMYDEEKPPTMAGLNAAAMHGPDDIADMAEAEIDRRLAAYKIMVDTAQALGWNGADFAEKFRQSYGVQLQDGTADQYQEVTDMMRSAQ